MNKMTRRAFLGKATAAALTTTTGCSGKRYDAVNLKVGVCADIHLVTVDYDGMHGVEMFEKTLRCYDRMGADAVVLGGDIADFGLVSELEMAASIWHKVFPDGRRSDGQPIMQCFHYGDHDLGGFAHKYRWAPKFVKNQDFLNHAIVNEDYAALWERLFHEKWAPIQVKKVKGYTFVLAHHPHNQAGSVIPGLAETLAAAKIDPSKPFFYSQHRPICGIVPEWTDHLESDSNYKALEAYPNVLAFFSHCHLNCADERSLWQGAFTAVQVPSTNYCGTRGNRENSFTESNRPTFDRGRKGRVLQMDRVPVERTHQMMFMEVYDDRIVISRHDLENDGLLGPDWTIPLPSPDGSCSPELRKAKSVAPIFPEGAKAIVTSGNGRDRAKHVRPEVVVTFPPAHARGRHPRAFDYEVTVTAESGKPIIVRRVFSSRPYWTDEKDVDPVRCVFGRFELPSEGEIAFSVRPANAFGVLGEALPTVKWMCA